MNEQQAMERWRGVFERAHGELWRLVCDFEADGLLIAAVRDERTVVAHCRATREMAPFHAIVGTHGRCEVRLPDDDRNVDVRHVVIRYDSNVALRSAIAAFDLDTATGFEIENGEARRAVTALDGPHVTEADELAPDAVNTVKGLEVIPKPPEEKDTGGKKGKLNEQLKRERAEWLKASARELIPAGKGAPKPTKFCVESSCADSYREVARKIYGARHVSEKKEGKHSAVSGQLCQSSRLAARGSK